MPASEYSFKSLAPALFLGIFMSAPLVISIHKPTLAAVLTALAVQSIALILWWIKKGKKLGAIVRVPLTLWTLAILGADVIFIVLQDQTIRGFVIASIGVFAALSYWLWFKRYYFASEYQKQYTRDWYNAMGILTFFVWSAAAFAFFILLRIPVWVTSTGLATLGALLMVLTLLAPSKLHGLGTQDNYTRSDLFTTVAVMFIVLLQLIWVLHFMPLGFFISAYLSTAVYITLAISATAAINRRVLLKHEKIALFALAALTILVLIWARWT